MRSGNLSLASVVRPKAGYHKLNSGTTLLFCDSIEGVQSECFGHSKTGRGSARSWLRRRGTSLAVGNTCKGDGRSFALEENTNLMAIIDKEELN